MGAGPEAEQEARRLWKEEKPDEYFFLEMYASAVVEHLTTVAGARLCAWAEGHHGRTAALQSRVSRVGHPEQARLLDVVRHTRKQPLPSQLDSSWFGHVVSQEVAAGRIRGDTSHGTLAAADGVGAVRKLFHRRMRLSPRALQTRHRTCQAGTAAAVLAHIAAPLPPLNREANYTIGGKALKRWADERLSLAARVDGGIDALFRYDGTTCTNMGRPLTFHYQVTLGPREDRYRIRDQRCTPAPGDTGHTYMCRYMNNAEHLMVAIDHEKPLLGKPLDDVLAWQRQASAAGCYCEPASREHKWGLVLETIHYALARQERKMQEVVALAETI